MVAGVKGRAGQHDLCRKQLFREGIVARVDRTVSQNGADALVRQGRRAEDIGTVGQAVADHVGGVVPLAVFPQEAVHLGDLGHIGTLVIDGEKQAAVPRAGQLDRHQLAAPRKVDSAPHADQRGQGAAQPFAGQVRRQQSQHVQPQQVKRRHRQRLVVVHVLHFGHEKDGEHRTNGR